MTSKDSLLRHAEEIVESAFCRSGGQRIDIASVKASSVGKRIIVVKFQFLSASGRKLGLDIAFDSESQELWWTEALIMFSRYFHR